MTILHHIPSLPTATGNSPVCILLQFLYLFDTHIMRSWYMIQNNGECIVWCVYVLDHVHRQYMIYGLIYSSRSCYPRVPRAYSCITINCVLQYDDTPGTYPDGESLTRRPHRCRHQLQTGIGLSIIGICIIGLCIIYEAYFVLNICGYMSKYIRHIS